MKFEEYLEFLLDTRIKVISNKIPKRDIREPVSILLKELDGFIKTPSEKLQKQDWFNIGWILAVYFGKKVFKMVYGNKIKG